MNRRRTYLSRAILAILLGLPGIFLLPFVLTLPEGVPPAAVLVNPLVLLILAALIGAWAAPKAGLESSVILGSAQRLRPLAAWLVVGLAMGLAAAFLDHATAPFWRPEGFPTLRTGHDGGALALGLLYGGITEEVLLRWGLMAGLAVGLMKVLPRGPSLWIAATLAAFAFALAHLPAVFMEAGDLTIALFLRTLLWNGLLGLAFGAAFLRHGLEAAILAHMGAHLGFAVSAL